MCARSKSTKIPARSTCLRYVAVDDVGVVINALTLHGQVHGGVAQGIGCGASANTSSTTRSRASSLSGSFMDYGMLRADDVCAFTAEDTTWFRPKAIPWARRALHVRRVTVGSAARGDERGAAMRWHRSASSISRCP